MTITIGTLVIGGLRTGPQGPPGPPGEAAAHAATHATGGGDELTPAAIGAVADTDPRLTDARTPTPHAASHAPGGSDALAPVAPLTVSTDTLTLLPEHHGRTLLYTHASGCAVTVPDDLVEGHAVEHRARGGGSAKIAFVAGGTTTFAQSPGCIAEIMAGGVAFTSVEPASVCALVGELTEAP